jgi:hypothetical protein
MVAGVIPELSHGKPLKPLLLGRTSSSSEVRLQTLIHTFSLSIYLGIIS